MDDASRPWRLARATSSPAAFCSRFKPSSSGIRRRRRASSVASCSSSASAFMPRRDSAARRTSICSRSKPGSTMTIPIVYAAFPAFALRASARQAQPMNLAGELGSAYEPEDPEVDEPDDEVDEPVLVEDDEDVLS